MQDFIFINKCRAAIKQHHGYDVGEIRCLMYNQNNKYSYAVFSAHEDADCGTIFECLLPDGGKDIVLKPYYSPMKVIKMAAKEL